MEKTVLITGCSSGIGRATALAFLDEEWTVYATARDEDDVGDLESAGCETAALDVTDPEEPAAVVERVVDEQGRVDCLVNNAGYGQLGAVEDVPPRKVRRQFDVNVLGPHRLIRAVLPHMRAAEDGTVVNVSSAAGRLTTPGMGVYGGSKSALEAVSDALRVEVAEHGVDVAVVEPGPVDTGFQDRAVAEADDFERTGAYEYLYEVYEDARYFSGATANSPEEVAAVVLEAGTSTNPAARYPVGPLATVANVARVLPDGLRDRAFGLVRRLV